MPASIWWPVDWLNAFIEEKKRKKKSMAAQDLWSAHNVALLTTEYLLWGAKNTIEDKK